MGGLVATVAKKCYKSYFTAQEESYLAHGYQATILQAQAIWSSSKFEDLLNKEVDDKNG